MASSSDPFEGYGLWIALGWSVNAMESAIDHINKIAATEPQEAFAAIGNAVWWITIVGDTLRHRHGPAYELALKSCTPPVQDTLLALKSVRNRIGHEVDLVDFITAVASRSDPGDGRITAWAWSFVPPPTRQHRMDMDGHHAYEAALAGRSIIEGLRNAASVLTMAHTNAQHGLPPNL